jgi:thiamine transporter
MSNHPQSWSTIGVPTPERRSRLNLNPAHWSVAALTEVALAVALAASLGLLKLFVMPQGGSVSLEMLPLLFLAVRRGVGPALVAGGLYGVVQLILPGAGIYYPAQVLLDYPLAFMAVAAAGLVRVTSWRTLALAVAVGCAARFVFHFLSGLLFFGQYAPPSWQSHWWGAFTYSITYNLLYIVPEALITVVVLWPLLKAYDAAFPAGGRAGGGPA